MPTLFRKRKKKPVHSTQLKSQKRRIDLSLLLAVVALSLFGLLMIFDASVVAAFQDFGDKYHFVREQVIWLLLGLGLVGVVSQVNYHRWHVYADILYVGMLVLLVAVFIPGVGIRALGANRWIDFRLFILQPAELTKLVMVVFLSSWLSEKKKHNLLLFVLRIGLILGLIVLEPDLGTAAIVLGIAVVLYFLSNAPLWHFLLLLPPAAAGVVVLALTSSYRLQRVLTFLDINQDPLGSSYHIRQVLLALGSGGLFGVGVGNSRQKYEYLPEASTDSIFAVVGEEFGFVGSVVLLLVFLFLIYRAFLIAQDAPDTFGKLLAGGISAWIAIQLITNLSAMVALVPLTGVPLPFISYGGSNLVVTLIGIGILLNISKQRNAP